MIPEPTIARQQVFEGHTGGMHPGMEGASGIWVDAVLGVLWRHQSVGKPSPLAAVARLARPDWPLGTPARVALETVARLFQTAFPRMVATTGRQHAPQGVQQDLAVLNDHLEERRKQDPCCPTAGDLRTILEILSSAAAERNLQATVALTLVALKLPQPADSQRASFALAPWCDAVGYLLSSTPKRPEGRSLLKISREGRLWRDVGEEVSQSCMSEEAVEAMQAVWGAPQTPNGWCVLASLMVPTEDAIRGGWFQTTEKTKHFERLLGWTEHAFLAGCAEPQFSHALADWKIRFPERASRLAEAKLGEGLLPLGRAARRRM